MAIANKKYYSASELAPYITEALKEGNTVRLTVSGNSMFPLFANRRDVVELEYVENESQIKKYDIVFYRRANGQYVLHRVLEKHKSHLVIAGDGEIEKEYAVETNSVIARVIAFTRKGKYATINSTPYKTYYVLWALIFPLRYFILNVALTVRRMFNGK